MTDRFPYVPPFELHGSASLRRLGVKGRRVTVGLGEGALFIADRRGRHVLTVPTGTIERALVGRETFKARTTHRLQLWSTETGAFVLRAIDPRDDMECYAAVVRGIAQDMEQRGVLEQMRLGLPRLYVFGAPVLVAILLSATALLATESAALRHTPPEDFLYGGLIIALILLAIGGWTFPQGFHRPVRRLSDLDPVLRR